MIERCFKCDGKGTQLEIDNLEEYCKSIFATASYRSVPCSRCLGSGALNYEIVKPELVKTSIVTGSQDKPE